MRVLYSCVHKLFTHRRKKAKNSFTPLLYLATHARPYPTGSVTVRRHRFYLTNESQLTNKHALDPSQTEKKGDAPVQSDRGAVQVYGEAVGTGPTADFEQHRRVSVCQSAFPK